jgi:hypothetical protein
MNLYKMVKLDDIVRGIGGSLHKVQSYGTKLYVMMPLTQTGLPISKVGVNRELHAAILDADCSKG